MVDADSNLLFAVIALQDDLIDQTQFADVCAGWALRRSSPLADLLVERGWLTDDDRREVERKLERKLRKQQGDLRATLCALAGDNVREAIRLVDEPQARQSLGALFPAGHVLIETLTQPTPEGPRSRYTLTRVHAEGGLGRVWLASDADLNREVALKEIKPGQAGSREASRRFFREAQITGQLEHPNIVPVYELDRRPGDEQPFYTMRFVRGRTLRQEIASLHRARAEGRVSALRLPRLLQAFVTICQAVGYAHSRGVIHRDLKPENVVIGDYGEVVVLDWGLAKLVGSHEEPEPERAGAVVLSDGGSPAEATRAGAQLGTPAYMAPEQAQGLGAAVDTRTDVYGLGTILFEMLTGRPPHDGPTTYDLLNEVAVGDTPRCRAIAPATPGALDAICARAMARERDDRYQSASDLAEDVQRWLADEPVSVYAEGLAARAGRWLRRHREWATAGVAALTVVAVAGTVATVAVNEARRHERAARDRVTQALAAERKAKAEAELNFQTARQAVQDYLTAVSESTLLKRQDRADLRALRKELLEGALGYYQGFITRHARDPRLEAELADAYTRVGSITDEIGSKETALRAYEQALAIRRKLAEAAPHDLALGDDLIAGYNNVANVARAVGRTDEARREYERAVAIGRGLTAARPADVPTRRSLAATYDNLGNLLRATGDAPAAARTYAHALEIRRRSADANPRDARLQSDLASSYNNIGNIQQDTGHLEDALRSYQQALAIRRELAEADPAATEHQSSLARLYGNIGVLQRTAGHADDALRSFEQALAIHRGIADANPSVSEFRSDLASSYNDVGVLQRAAGRTADALRSYESALAIRRTLAESDPTVSQYQADLAASYNNIGVVMIAAQRWDDALRSFEQALAIRRKLADDLRSVTGFQSELAASYSNVGVLQRAAGRTADALRSFEQALTIRRALADANPSVPHYRIDLAASLTNLAKLRRETGRPADARTAFDEALRLWESLGTATPDASYNQACVLAQLSALERGGPNQAADRTRAVQALRRSVAAGYGDLTKVTLDGDLDPLRSLPEFQSLLMDLAFPADPFAPQRSK